MIYPIGAGLIPHLWDNNTTFSNHFNGFPKIKTNCQSGSLNLLRRWIYSFSVDKN